MLLGNKADLIEEDSDLRQISEEIVQNFTEEHNLLYNETSAKTG